MVDRLRFEGRVDVVLNCSHSALDIAITDWALPTGTFQARFDLVAREWDARAVLLNDLDRRFFDALVGRVAPLAFQTLATSSNGEAILTGAGIDDAVVIHTTEGTFHGNTIHQDDNP